MHARTSIRNVVNRESRYKGLQDFTA